ncbi:MAG: NAD(P)H-hydrate dehydratase [Xanthobacteraceae bacterium]|nr:NAD(P)H-hydrate dehydratase [Xanthobacteraceae bacterium]QYK46499.1 MAG: NAD(P)H-hydrate dehydratase [Xanthobacteraceae bacterium]
MLELLTPREMAEADRLTIEDGTPGIELMERAGAAVAEAVYADCKSVAEIAVVCGPGNNGGDGFVAARLLREHGLKVSLFLLGARDALKGDAAIAAGRWGGEVLPVADADFSRFGLIVDALFGGGLSRDLEGEAREAVERMDSAGLPVVAVDLPSGIDGATGQVRGAAVRAKKTLTFCRMKPGHLLLPGRVHAGEIIVAGIGISDDAVMQAGSRLTRNSPDEFLAKLRWPRIDGHKYQRGHAVVVSGPAYATGAARLAATAALRAGAGLVTVAAPKAAVPVLAASLTAVMVREASGAAGLKKLLADKRMNAVLLGPAQGVGKATVAAIEAAGKTGRPLVLDADAISSFTGESGKLAKLLKLNRIRAILTPHEGEFARLFGSDSAEILGIESKVERVRAAAKFLRAVIVLKGADTVVAAPDGRATISDNAPPWLGTAGSGDVLAGIIVAMLAHGMTGFDAANAAVWMHGEAARVAGPGMISEDLLPAIRTVVAGLYQRAVRA